MKYLSLRTTVLLSLLTFTIVVMIEVAKKMGVAEIPSDLILFSRWLFLTCFSLFAIKKKSLTVWILVAMSIGVEIGLDAPEFAKSLKKLSDIFLRIIKTIVAPLLFGTLVVGIAGHSNLKQVGRMGIKSIIYFEIVTTLALFIGLVSINLSKAGVGAHLDVQAPQLERAEKLLSQRKEHDVVLDIFPENIAKSIAEGQVLQVVVFSILFGIGLAMMTGKRKETMLDFAESLSEVMFMFTKVVMYFAPFAVGGAIAFSVASMGIDMLKNLFMLLATLYIALIAFVLLVFIPIGLLIKLDFKKFIQAISEPVSIAFATASSEAALPKAMENMEKMGIPRKIVSFVLPTGYSFNLDGTTLYLSLASVFVAQACGIDLTIGQQIEMCVILMLTSKGVAGVRGASFLILVGTLDSLGIDSHKAFAILGIDALMDMARTSVNVVGNCLATVVVARWENEYPQPELIGEK
jgi:proton glutamate symport protein